MFSNSSFNNLDVNSTLDFNKDIEIEEKLLKELLENMDKNADEFLSNNYSKRLATIIKDVLANANPNNKTYNVSSLIDNTYKYLSSLQIYDNSPFIVPCYGSSEFSQSICRMSSLLGTIYIVSQNISFEVVYNNDTTIDRKYKILVSDTGIYYILNTYV